VFTSLTETQPNVSRYV